MINKIFSKEEKEKHILYRAIDYAYKMLHFLPQKQKIFILGLFDNYYRWEYEIRHKKFSYEEIFELFRSQALYPKNILSVEDTINYIVDNNCSISRLGDGEEFLFNMLNDNPTFPELKQKLLDICANGTTSNCLVCINNFNADNENCPDFYRKHFTHYYSKIVSSDKIKKIKFSKNIYGDAYALQFFSEISAEKDVINEKIKSIWNKRKVLFVINKYSAIINDTDCFTNVESKDYYYIPKENAYSKYNQIFEDIISKYDNSYLVYIEGGAMASVLSYELSKQGYTALDMGGYYKKNYDSKKEECNNDR